MKTQIRILRRRAAEIDPTMRDRTPRQHQREQRILAIATDLFARCGPYAMSFTNLAKSMQMAPTTMRWHFVDLHELLGEIMRRHLQALLAAIEAIPPGTSNRQRLQREAYVKATRAGAGLTPAHHILTTYRTQLPQDERELVDALRDQIGAAIGGAKAQSVFTLLDSPCFDINQIERMLATLPPEQTAAPRAHPAPQIQAPRSEISMPNLSLAARLLAGEPVPRLWPINPARQRHAAGHHGPPGAIAT